MYASMSNRIAVKLGLLSAAALSIGGISEAQADECHTFSPDEASQESSLVVDVVSNSGYTDDGSLRWPNGKTMFLRNDGYVDDESVFWPNGKVLLKRHDGYVDDHSLFWPTGKTMLTRHEGYVDDGSTFHSDGSPWLVRNAGYTDDNARQGGARSKFRDRKHSISARLVGDGGIRLSAKTYGDDWVVTINYSAAGGLRITECLTDGVDNDFSEPKVQLKPVALPPKPSYRPTHSGSRLQSYSSRTSYSSTTINGRTTTHSSKSSSGRRAATPRARHSVDFGSSAPSRHGALTTDPVKYDECVDWAYKIYFQSLNSAPARDAARKNCKNVELEVARLLQPYYFKSLNAGPSMDEALKMSSKGNLANRLDVIRFAMKAYFESLNGAPAASAAVKHVASVPSSKDSKRLLKCLKTEYTIYFRSLNSDKAMDKAFEVCGD